MLDRYTMKRVVVNNELSIFNIKNEDGRVIKTISEEFINRSRINTVRDYYMSAGCLGFDTKAKSLVLIVGRTGYMRYVTNHAKVLSKAIKIPTDGSVVVFDTINNINFRAKQLMAYYI